MVNFTLDIRRHLTENKDAIKKEIHLILFWKCDEVCFCYDDDKCVVRLLRIMMSLFGQNRVGGIKSTLAVYRLNVISNI